MWLMGVDMGTSGCKAVVFDEKWNVAAQACREYSLHFPGEGLLELNSELVWESICRVIKEANAEAAEPVEALAVSAIGDVIIPLGADGAQIRNSIVDFDPRGAEEIKSFVGRFGAERFFNLTGMPPLYIGSLSKMLWLSEHEPETCKAVSRWATYEDFIVGKLGLDPCVSYGEAARTMLFDIRKKDWCDEVLEQAGISRDKLPTPVPSATKIGTIPEALAAELGFTVPVTVASGGHDMICAAVGAGLDERNPGVAVDISGTIEGVVAALPEPNTSDRMLGHALSCYPAYSGYVTFSVNLTSGCVVRWFRDKMLPDEKERCERDGENIFGYMHNGIDPDKPGGLMFIPHFSGSGNPHFDPLAQGAVYGLSLDTTRSDIARAMFEGLAYELKYHVEALRGSGIDLRALRAVGGGNRNPVELQMKANILGLDLIQGGVAESSALGAAAYAATAMGVISDPADAYLAIKSKEKLFEAKPNELFEKAFIKYVVLSNSIHEYENAASGRNLSITKGKYSKKRKKASEQ